MAEAVTPHKISNITAGFMIMLALLFDLLQFLLTIFVVTALLAELVTFFALCVYGVWFAIMRVNYFSGNKTGLKAASAFGSAVLELVPVLDGLPGITMGVIGVIAGTRLEEKAKSVVLAPPAQNQVRFGPQKISSAANDNDGMGFEEAA